jgi:hypothetical protein
MANNLAKFCYDFIKQNEKIIYNLEQYNLNVSPDFDNIKNFILNRTCCNKYYNFIEEMLKNIQYVSCDEIINILENNINNIINYVSQTNCIPILITTLDSIGKSNCFFSLYTLYKLKEKGIMLSHIYARLDTVIEKSGDIFNIKDSLNIKKDANVLIIFCDDISYSGKQLATHINDNSMHYIKDQFPRGITSGFSTEYRIYNKLKFNDKIKIFLNVCGLLPEAHDLIVKQFEIRDQLIIPSEVIKFKGILNLNELIKDQADKNNQSKDQFIKLNDCYILNKDDKKLVLESQFKTHLQIDKHDINILSFVYPFHKYPDALSTYNKLCFIKRFDNLLSLNVKMFIQEYNITEEDFCTFVKNSNINLGDLLEQANVDKYTSAKLIKKIRENYNNHKNISDIKWIEVCEPNKPNNLKNNFENKQGKWFNTLQNILIENEAKEKFDGYCDKIIPSFYKKLTFNYNENSFYTGTTVKSLEEIKEDAEKSAKLKYIKYKTKYIQLKNMCKNLNS